MSFAPCSFSLESAKHRKGTHPPPLWQVAQHSSYYDLGVYPDRVMLCNTVPHQYTYWLLPNAEDAAVHVASSLAAERQWLFCIENGRPVYAYMDLDRPCDATVSVARFIELAQLATTLFVRFIDALYGFSPLARPDAFQDDEWHYYQACTDAKLSVHAHSRILFASIDVLGAVVAHFRTWLEWRRTSGDQSVQELFYTRRRALECIVDFRVYTKRPFRLPLNRKDVAVQNYLRPVHPPLASQVDEILRGFIHPWTPNLPTPLPHPDELTRIRNLLPSPAVVRNVSALSRAICEFIIAVYKVPLARHFCQSLDDPEGVGASLATLTDAQCVQLLGIVCHIVERAVLLEMPTFLEFEQRGQVLQVAWEVMSGFGATGVAQMATMAQEYGVAWTAADDPRFACDYAVQRAFVALEISTRREGATADLIESFCSAMSGFLRVPLAHVPLAFMRLCQQSPFLWGGVTLPAPLGAYQ